MDELDRAGEDAPVDVRPDRVDHAGRRERLAGDRVQLLKIAPSAVAPEPPVAAAEETKP
jgi:hypothetical protein